MFVKEATALDKMEMINPFLVNGLNRRKRVLFNAVAE